MHSATGVGTYVLPLFATTSTFLPGMPLNDSEFPTLGAAKANKTVTPAAPSRRGDGSGYDRDVLSTLFQSGSGLCRVQMEHGRFITSIGATR